MKHRKRRTPSKRKPISRETMGAREYKRRIADMGLTQVGAARFFGVSDRTGRYWIQKGPPQVVAMCIYLMDWNDYSVEDVEERL